MKCTVLKPWGEWALRVRVRVIRGIGFGVLGLKLGLGLKFGLGAMLRESSFRCYG